MRPITNLQRQRITLTLFFSVAIGAVITVAAPAFMPCPAFEDNRKAALLERRKRQKQSEGTSVLVIERDVKTKFAHRIRDTERELKERNDQK
ncbi:uncharacterized protein VTP21DRAFT_10384 [Calcarisporiella thermophila]|uniref:uncharacterized protein n=1 Tax=Calcarisporiella thermophila TaxID=911321 RepID=UPI003742D93F